MSSGASTAGASVQRDGDTLRVGGVLDFGSARDALDAVGPAIQSSAALTIDLGAVTRANSAGLALMIEWLAVARSAGHTVRFEGVPDGLLQLARVCQVEPLIQA